MRWCHVILSRSKACILSGENLIRPVTLPGKILFITPPCHCGVAEISGRWVPLNFIYLAGSAREAGVRAEIYDAMALDHGFPEIEERLRASMADYVAVTAMTATIGDAVKTLELVKRIDPDAVTILGGVHPTFMYDELLRSTTVLDYLVIGEGEVTLHQLLTILEGGGDPAAVAGIAFRQGDEIIRTQPRALMMSLDDLPTAWDLLEWEIYTYHIIPGSCLGAVSTSRGCDSGCRFCSQSTFWERSWRGRDPRKVAEELEQLHITYGVNVFLMVDEHPTKDRARWEEILDLLVVRQLPISLIMETRAADIVRDRDILGKYHRAGIIHVSIGVESADPGRMEFLGKEQSVDEVREALQLLQDEGIVSEASFLVGFPDESAESVNQTLRQARSLNPDIANFMPLTPWPYAGINGASVSCQRDSDYARYNLVDPVTETFGMSLSQLEGAINSCFRKFNMGKMIDIMSMKDDFRRAYLLRATKLMMSSTFIMKKLGAGILGGIPAKVSEVRKKLKGDG